MTTTSELKQLVKDCFDAVASKQVKTLEETLNDFLIVLKKKLKLKKKTKKNIILLQKLHIYGQNYITDKH